MTDRRVAVVVTAPILIDAVRRSVKLAMGASLRRPQPDGLVRACSRRIGDAAVVVDLPADGGEGGRDRVGPRDQEQERAAEGEAYR